MNRIQIYFVVIVILDLSRCEVSSLDIDCVPLENCSFVNNILAKGRISESILKFINSSKCGVDKENPKKVKVWCNQFKNCKTSDSRNGTCIPISTCAEFNDLFQSTKTDQQKQQLFNDYRCNFPDHSNDDLVCCTWPNVQDGGKVRRKRHYQFPWSMSRHRHFHDNNFGFFNDGQFNENELEHNNIHFTPKEGNYKHDHGLVGHWWKHKLLDADNSIEDRKGGDICFTPDNIKGFCKEIRKCSNMVNVLKTMNRLDNAAVEYLKKYKCSDSTQSNIKVCCPKAIITMPEVDSQTETRVKTTADDNLELECGRQMLSDRIVGGTTASLSEFPWTALLQYNTSKGLVSACGGTVINKRYIITAAHCVNGDILEKNDLQTLDRIILGEYDTRNETDCIYTKYGSDCADPAEYFNFERIIIHESFSSNGTANDIALIRVDRDIQFTNYIRPICLPVKSSFRLKGNENFSITGWGRTQSGNVSPVKKKATLPFVDKSRCSQLGPLGDGQICLGSDKGVDSCKGDSGGPVMIAAISGDELVTTLVGIISYGFGTCGTTTSVCTYVPFYLDWISRNLEG